MKSPVEELIELIAVRPNQAFLLIGSGVSIATTRNASSASWRGLLDQGVSYCVSQLGLDAGWESLRRQQLKASELIQVASEISAKLGAPMSGRYSEWLTQTIGSLGVEDPRLIDALQRFGVNIATTNYDNLIEQRTSRPSIAWGDHQQLTPFIRGTSRDVLHLHGDYRRSDTVVFDAGSYYKVSGSSPIQALMKALCLARSPIFVGCGTGGLNDPNIGGLIKWCGATLNEMVCPGFLITHEAEISDWNSLLGHSQIRLISSGKSHDDLAGFLEGIANKVSLLRDASNFTDTLASAQNGFDVEVQAVTSRAGSLGPADALRQRIRLAKAHWAAGGKRSAWVAISGSLERDGGALPVQERLQYVLELAQMQLSDANELRAFDTLGSVSELVETDKIPSEMRENYWGLRARCLEAMGFYSDAREILDKAIETSESNETRARLRAERAEILFLQNEESIPELLESEDGTSTASGPDSLLIESTTPGVRHALIDFRVMAMRGEVKEALVGLGKKIGQRTSAGHDADTIALAMLRAEILYLDDKRDEARDQFEQVIKPRLAHLSTFARFAVAQNHIDLRAELFSPESSKAITDFYHLHDLRIVSGMDLQDTSEIVDGLSAANRGDYREAITSFWREALRTYRQACWSVHRAALGRLGRGWLSIGEPVDATFCAIGARDEKLADSICEHIIARRDSEVVRKVVALLISSANLRNHFCIACSILGRIADAVPDDQVETVAEWLIAKCGISEGPQGSSGLLFRAWQALAPFASRISPILAHKAVRIGTGHPVWLYFDEARASIPRKRIVMTLNSIVPALPATEMESLARDILPLAMARRKDYDYRQVLDLLCHVSHRGGCSVNALIGSHLFGDGCPIDYFLAQLAPIFGKSVLDGDRLKTVAINVAKNARLQVQRKSPDQEFDPVLGVILTMKRQEPDQSVQVSYVNLIDWHAVVPHRTRLDGPTLRGMVDAAIAMLVDPDNDLGNRLGLIRGLSDMSDVLQPDMIDDIVLTLEPLSHGDIDDPNAHRNSPLGGTQYYTTTPETLRGAAVFGLAQIGARDPERYRKRVEEQIQQAMGCANVEVRTGAIEAFRAFPCRSENLLLWALLATRDLDPNAAASAFAAIVGKDGLVLTRNHWQLLLASTQMASLSNNVHLRRQAAAALAWMSHRAPNGAIRSDVLKTLQVFANDDSASVRNAARPKIC